MGGPLGTDTPTKPDHCCVSGPCLLHLTTFFDLTCHGMKVVSRSCHQSLPQVMLEVRGKDVWAVVRYDGPRHGYDRNPKA